MKHNGIVDVGAPPKRDASGAVVLRELSELADDLQRNGMMREAAVARNAAKLIRRLTKETP